MSASADALFQKQRPYARSRAQREANTDQSEIAGRRMRTSLKPVHQHLICGVDLIPRNTRWRNRRLRFAYGICIARCLPPQANRPESWESSRQQVKNHYDDHVRDHTDSKEGRA